MAKARGISANNRVSTPNLKVRLVKQQSKPNTNKVAP